MSDLEEKIRNKAYEIWEREGQSGNPEDHWFEAEREIRAAATEPASAEARSEATVEEAPPAETVEAAETADNRRRNGRSRSKA